MKDAPENINVTSEKIDATSEKIETIGLVILVAIGAAILAFGSWYIKREINYSFQYQGKVQEQINNAIAPLQKRIEQLEREAAKKTL